jgi:MoxR-like ATPase
VRLGPLGTALLPWAVPRVLLIDEIDKSDVDLPNDLLNVMEEGEFDIPELARAARTTPRVAVQTYDLGGSAEVSDGRVRCREFPITIMTSNGEREFPPAFLRRCIRLDLPEPDEKRLTRIVQAHLGAEATREADDLVARFLARRERGELATDQLLNAVYLTQHAAREKGSDRDHLADIVLRHLSAPV